MVKSASFSVFLCVWAMGGGDSYQLSAISLYISRESISATDLCAKRHYNFLPLSNSQLAAILFTVKLCAKRI